MRPVMDGTAANPTPISPVGKVVGRIDLDTPAKAKRKAKGLSPTQRTLRALKEQGRIAAIVEKWNPFGGPMRTDGKGRVGNRSDLLGFGDVLWLDSERGIGLAQCCAASGHAAHRRKILEETTEYAIEWLKCGGIIELWSWAKRKLVRGGKAERWTPRVEEITLAAFQGVDDGGSDAAS